jgi:hypothetical protein
VPPDEHVAGPTRPGFPNPQVPEVRVVRIDRDAAALPTLAAERGHLVHLVDEGRNVLFLGFRDGVPQLEELGVEIFDLLGVGLGLALQPLSHVLQDAQLLVDDVLPAVGQASL